MKKISSRNYNSLLVSILSLAFFCFIVSCEKEKVKLKEFSANIDGKAIETVGAAALNIYSNSDTVYMINTRSVTSPSSSDTADFYFSEIRNLSLTDSKIITPNDFEAKILTINPISKIASRYDATVGELKVSLTKPDLIEGTFNLVFVNFENMDTVNVSSGKFKITYSTYWITTD